MAKPFVPEWASNNTYVGGADAGSNTKQEQDAAHATDGFIKGGKVEPDKWNLWRYRIAESLNNAASIGPRTMFRDLKDTSAGGYDHTLVGYGAGSVIKDHAFGVFDPNDARHLHTFCLTDSNLATEFFEVNSQGQYAWVDSITAGGPFPINLGGAVANHDLQGLGIDANSTRMIACNNGLYGLLYSIGYGAWTAWLTGNFIKVKHNHLTGGDALWVVVNYVGGNHIISTTTAPLVALTGRASGATAATWGVLAYSYHQADDLYPGDTGNPMWLYIDSTGGFKRRSADGITWTTPTGTTAGYTLKPADNDCLAYSRWSKEESTEGRWGMIVPKGTATTNQTFVYSDDNGDTWTEVSDAFSIDADTSINAINDFHLCSDGWGTWMACAQVEVLNYYTGGARVYIRTRMWCSSDNGLTWERTDLSIVNERSGAADTIEIIRTEDNNTAGSALWYGDGAFHFALNGYRAAVATDIKFHLSTLRLWQD